MIPELGHFALILALLVALVQGTLPLLGAHRRDAALMAIAKPAARAQFVLVAFASFLVTSLVFPVATTWGTFLHAAGPSFNFSRKIRPTASSRGVSLRLFDGRLTTMRP